MTKPILTLLFVTLLAPHTFAKGGTVVGDGGHSVVCDEGKDSSTVELFDIYQARKHFHLGFLDSPVLWETQTSVELILRGLNVLNLGSAQDAFRESVSRAQMMELLVTEYDILPYTQDVSTYDRLPANCEFKQLGITHEASDRVGVSVAKAEWQRLDRPQRAMFLLHEALHFQIRDPEAVRQIIAFVIAPTFFQIQNRALIERIFATGQAVLWNEFVLVN